MTLEVSLELVADYVNKIHAHGVAEEQQIASDVCDLRFEIFPSIRNLSVVAPEEDL